MDLLEIFESKNISSQEYQSMFYDISYFYLLNSSSNYVDKFDYKFNYINTIELNVKCDFLCFDKEEQCFYGLQLDKNISILKLDKSFNLDFKHNVHCDFSPTSFKLCNKNNVLIIGCKNYFFEINKYNFEIINEFHIPTNDYYFNTKYKNYFLCCSNNLSVPTISLFDEHKLITKIDFKYNTEIVDIVVHNNTIIILANKNNFSFIFKARINNKVLNNIYKNNDIFNDDLYTYEELDDINNLYNEDYRHCDNNNCTSCDCQNDNCSKHSCKHSCKHNKKCNVENSLCEILHSIALVEVGIAHILSAEGEKIQKVLECTCDINEILNTNKCVSQTISKLTKLEETLCCKLEAITNIKNF